MTLTLFLLAFLVAVAAAVRSTWSPCGLSMLSTITPFGERAKGHRYAATSAWFVVGAVAGGLTLGALMAAGAVLVHLLGPTATAVGVTGLAATLAVLASDTGLAGARIPFHCRQVNERWLDAYRPWVYGAGFGFQIGCGVATYITTAAVYLTAVLGALTGRPLVALAVGGTFGLVRGLAVLLTRHLTDPTALLAFHQRFAALLPAAQQGVVAATVVSAVTLGIAVGVVPAAVTVAAVGLVVGTVRLAVSRRRAGAAVPVPPTAAAADAGPVGTKAEVPSVPVG